MQLINVFTALALLTSTYAAIIEPQAGAEWIAGKEGSITWETAKFGAKVDIALVPAGATDMSVTMVDIAKATENTGSMQWILPPTMAVGACSIIISNSQAGSTASTTTSTSSTSGVTIIIIEGSRTSNGGSSKNGTAGAVPAVAPNGAQTQTIRATIGASGNSTQKASKTIMVTITHGGGSLATGSPRLPANATMIPAILRPTTAKSVATPAPFSNSTGSAAEPQAQVPSAGAPAASDTAPAPGAQPAFTNAAQVLSSGSFPPFFTILVLFVASLFQ